MFQKIGKNRKKIGTWRPAITLINIKGTTNEKIYRHAFNMMH